jgi:tRNA(fMet)-specific endonuclease VapC
MVSRYILDTDHFSLYQRLHPEVLERVNQIDQQQLAITVITVEEQMIGWLNAVQKAQNKSRQINWAYTQLRESVQLANQFSISDFTIAANERFLQLRSQGIRIGTKDLRIASIALEVDATIVTRNRKDFDKVPNLAIVDWSIP